MANEDLPFLDISASGFSTRGAEVLAARDAHWCARTPFGKAILRHREAGMLLRDRRMRQGSHAWPDKIGISGSFANFWKQSVISQEGGDHKTLRQIAVPALSKDFIDGLLPAFSAIATDLTGALASGPCEFMEDFATPFAGRAICSILNISHDNWFEVATDASLLGLAMGLEAPQHEARFNAACDRLSERAAALLARARSGNDPSGYVMRVLQNAEARADLSDDALINLIVISIFGGVDTTRAQLGFLMQLFVENPDQWALLHKDRALAPDAVEESLRHRPTTTWSTREANEDFEFGGVLFEKGETVFIFAHATATDPAICKDRDFDITLRRKAHFGFGGGAHACLGQAVARADIACALEVLAERFVKIESSGAPAFLADRGNTSPDHLPLLFS